MPEVQNDDDERLPRTVRRNPAKPVAKLCVNCLTPLERGSGLGGWLVPQDYYCPVCGYKGYVYVERTQQQQHDQVTVAGEKPRDPGKSVGS